MKAVAVISSMMNDSDDQDKEEFYRKLLTIIQDRPERNIIIVMGDLMPKLAVTTGAMRRSWAFWSCWQQRYMEICGTFMLASGKYSKPERPMKDKDGQPISDSEGQKHFGAF